MAGLVREPSAPSSHHTPALQASTLPPITSPNSREYAEQPQLSSLANEGLKASAADPTNRLKRPLPFEPPALTGAAALADQQRQQQQDDAKRQKPQLTSANPASSVKSTLLGQSSPTMNKTSDRPSSPSQPQRPATPPRATPMITLANTATVAEPMQVEQTSPVSMTEDESNALRNSHAPHPSVQDNRSLAVTSDHSQPNKALTYPPPQSPAEEAPGRARTLSYPNPSSAPGSASKGSGKKHKCPNCDTEFTRHHNLKSHLLTHSQEKPYVCTSCNAKFRRLHDLKRHNKLHTGERPHICTICGRKFARGDALARHAKGPAGCAGRRGSGMGDDEDGNSEINDSMEGVVYNGDGDEGMSDAQRRRSEPHRKNTAPTRTDTGSSTYRASTNTYPPVANMINTPRSSIGQTTPGQPPHNQLNINGPHFQQVHYSTSPGSYSQPSGVVESPKPLSPSQPEPHRLSASEASRNRSPSLAQHLQQTHFGRGSGRGTPPLNLPAPSHGSQGQQLPSLPSLTADRNNAFHPHGGRLGSNSGPVLPSQNGSAGGSGSSVRDLMSSPGREGDPNDIMNYVRQMEARMEARMKDQMDSALRNQKAEYEGRISQMQNEINSLRSHQTESNGESIAKKG